MANRDKRIIATGKPMPGSMPDLDMFRDTEIDLGPLSKSMNDENVAKKIKLRYTWTRDTRPSRRICPVPTSKSPPRNRKMPSWTFDHITQGA